MFIKNIVLRNLIILLSSFIIGFGALIVIHYLFTKYTNDLDKEIRNEQARYKIGEFILKEINSLETNFYKIVLTYNEKSTLPIEDEIIEKIISINKAIDVLENGGKVDNYFYLNIVGIEKINDIIKFIPNKKEYNYESITLRPKLALLEKKIYKIKQIVKLKKESLNFTKKEDIENANFEIQLLSKQIPSFFIRMKESSARLLYESKNNLNRLENDIEKKKDYYKKLEYITSYITISIVLIFGYLLTKMILIKSKELETITKKAEQSALEASNANKIKSQFLANMSHEIRTPLNAIIGFSDILSTSKIPNEEKEKAIVIAKSAKALLEIINDILDISKVESGKLEILNEEFKIKKLLNQIVELYSINAKQKDIRLVFDLDGNTPYIVNGDETRLKQVLSNLLSNAIKFTASKSKVTFNVAVKKINEDTAKIRFVVKDEGIGISSNDQKKIFEPFSQADGSISRRFGGTGLGLAISLKIVQLMGSKIELISKEGLGSTFYFTLNLPIVKMEKETSPSHRYTFFLDRLEKDYENTRENVFNILKEFANIIDTPTTINEDTRIDAIFCFTNNKSMANALKIYKKLNVPIIFIGDRKKVEVNKKFEDIEYFDIDVPIFGSKIFNIVAKTCSIENDYEEKNLNEENICFNAKVLVAEDNTNNQLLIELLLQRLKIDVKIVNNGKEAIDEFRQNNYDLVFMDINMPIMDGIASMKRIKELDKYKIKKTPIIALTANTIKGDKEKYIKEGMDNYLSKPIEYKQLIKILSHYLPLTLVEEKEKSPTSTSSLDIKKISSTLNVSENIVLKIIDKFKEDIVIQLDEFESIIKEENIEEIRQKAHYIKNSCLNVALEDVCLILENIENNNYDTKQLNLKFQEIKKLIENYL